MLIKRSASSSCFMDDAPNGVEVNGGGSISYLSRLEEMALWTSIGKHDCETFECRLHCSAAQHRTVAQNPMVDMEALRAHSAPDF